MSTTIDLLNVREAAQQRRSIRQFEQQPIPSQDMDEILDVVRLAPSAFNVQPWRFVIVETPELKAQLAAAAFNQRQVLSAPAVIVLYTDMADALANIDEVIHPGMDAVQRATTRQSILRVFEKQTEDQRESWGAAQGHIALGYLLLAAESQGYQTSPMAGFDAEAVKTLLNLPANARVPALVAIGRGTEEGFTHHRHALGRIARAA